MRHLVTAARWRLTWLALFAVVVACGGEVTTSGGDDGDAGARVDGGHVEGDVDGGHVHGANVDAMADELQTCGELGASAACSECLADACCAEEDACLGDADCSALVDCARECAGDDADCRGACVMAYPQGRIPYNELTLCMGEHCLTPCPFTTP